MAYLFTLLQRVLPKYAMTAVVYRIARIRLVGFKNFLIRQYVRLYKVNVDEIAAEVPDEFETFNAFFVRELAAGARPIDDSPRAIVSPVAGTVSAHGAIEKDMLFQAKGFRYSLADLLAADIQDADPYVDGEFATIYLAPYNYHRVHAPLAGSLRLARYVPGELFSVNAATVDNINALFARNERLVCHFDSDDGPYILIFVGALNVGSISTPWTGELRPRASGVIEDHEATESTQSPDVGKGDLLGWFNMGSTVILLLPKGRGQWSDILSPGKTLQMGERIGDIKLQR